MLELGVPCWSMSVAETVVMDCPGGRSSLTDCLYEAASPYRLRDQEFEPVYKIKLNVVIFLPGLKTGRLSFASSMYTSSVAVPLLLTGNPPSLPST